MNSLLSEAWGTFTSALFFAWLVGNFIWAGILHALGNALGVSWLEVDHALRVFSWSPTVKELHEQIEGGLGGPEFSKNFQW
jgi:hypothetical protein